MFLLFSSLCRKGFSVFRRGRLGFFSVDFFVIIYPEIFSLNKYHKVLAKNVMVGIMRASSLGKS